MIAIVPVYALVAMALA